jgi:hypothetical protein
MALPALLESALPLTLAATALGLVGAGVGGWLVWKRRNAYRTWFHGQGLSYADLAAVGSVLSAAERADPSLILVSEARIAEIGSLIIKAGCHVAAEAWIRAALGRLRRACAPRGTFRRLDRVTFVGPGRRVLGVGFVLDARKRNLVVVPLRPDMRFAEGQAVVIVRADGTHTRGQVRRPRGVVARHLYLLLGDAARRGYEREDYRARTQVAGRLYPDNETVRQIYNTRDEAGGQAADLMARVASALGRRSGYPVVVDDLSAGGARVHARLEEGLPESGHVFLYCPVYFEAEERLIFLPAEILQVVRSSRQATYRLRFTERDSAMLDVLNRMVTLADREAAERRRTRESDPRAPQRSA